VWRFSFAISAFKSSAAVQGIRLTVWRVDCTSGSVVRRKTKNSKEIQDHGKSKDGKKGKEAGISEAAQLVQEQAPDRRVISLKAVTAGFAFAPATS
jgi:hypothetical protein